jgi:hypothetical protein
MEQVVQHIKHLFESKEIRRKIVRSYGIAVIQMAVKLASDHLN